MMVDPISVVTAIQLAGEIIVKIFNFCKKILDAPEEFRILANEAKTLQICVKVLKYKECKILIRWLYDNRRAQYDDLLVIVKTCNRTMTEMIDYVNECKLLATQKARETDNSQSFRRRTWNMIKHGAILWFLRIKHAATDTQPMRDKVAIPTRALNIYLTTLTFVSIQNNLPLANGPVVYASSSTGGPQISDGWDVVGRKTAFRDVEFPSWALDRIGVEDKILLAAERIINGDSCCKLCEAGCLCSAGRRRGRPRGRSLPVSNPLRGRTFLGVVRNPDGTKEVVRNRVPSRSRSRSRPRLLADFPFNPTHN